MRTGTDHCRAWVNARPERLLAPREMAEADRRTIERGTSGFELMRRAGRAIADEIIRHFEQQPVAILCGPGNNGGDGYIVGELLRERGWPVRILSLTDPERLKGDAAIAFAQCGLPVERLDQVARCTDAQGTTAPQTPRRENLIPEMFVPETLILESLLPEKLIVDALFGAGLDRALPEPVAGLFAWLNDRAVSIVAVDVPSGVDGASGRILGGAPKAHLTVSFAAAKPGHYLQPGAEWRGELVVANIGIEDQVLEEVSAPTFANTPALWCGCIPKRRMSDHKYTHGHALIMGGPAEKSGASRLAAMAAQRIGAGLTTIAVPGGSAATYAAHLTTIMQRDCAGIAELQRILDDQRFNALLIGPGFGVGDATRDMTLALLTSARACVVDADALSAFEDNPQTLFQALHPSAVLTPHDGEYSRLFATPGSRLERARAAAAMSGAVVLLKGADTVVAAPDGRAAIATNPSACLATAGTGDVLAGSIVGLMARGVPAFEAACAANWINNAAAHALNDAGRSFIAEDLPMTIGDQALQFYR